MYEFQVWQNIITEDSELSVTKTEISIESEERLRIIQGKEFEEFLDLCFQEATHFSLKKAIWTYATNTRLQQALEPFMVKSIRTYKWFGYDFTSAPMGEEREMEILIYKATDDARKALVENCTNIFLEDINEKCQSMMQQNIEDLCFFKEGRIIIGTVSHAYVLECFPHNEVFERSVLNFGNWIQKPGVEVFCCEEMMLDFK